MKIIIKAKNLKLTGDIENFVEKKIMSLKKFIDILKKDVPGNLKTLAEIFVEVQRETKHHKKGEIFRVKARVHLPGNTIVAWARSDDLFVAVVEAKNELKTEIEKYKFKKIDKSRRQGRKK